jgi:hypothetical protein
LFFRWGPALELLQSADLLSSLVMKTRWYGDYYFLTRAVDDVVVTCDTFSFFRFKAFSSVANSCSFILVSHIALIYVPTNCKRFDTFSQCFAFRVSQS